MPSKADQANACKEAGNKAFASGDYAGAVTAFTEALVFEPKNETFFSNRSAAYCKLKNYEQAIEDAKQAIALKPKWAKGYARAGAALLLDGNFAAAQGIYQAGVDKAGDDKALASGLETATKAVQKQTDKALKKKTKKAKAKKSNLAANEILEDIENLQIQETEQDNVDPDDHVIGIDLGTTFSCVGVWQKDSVHIITTDDGEKTIPSYVAFMEPDMRRVTGHAAKNQAARNPKNTIYDVKRIIGQRFSDTGVEQDISKFPFKVKKGKDNKPMIVIGDKNGKETTYAPEQISAMVLANCKAIAEKYLKVPVNKAVITVPAYFNDAQRSATKTAGVIAGLEVMRIINEPTAAALSYGLDTLAEKKKGTATNILIFDLGGGTFDVSILTIENGVFSVVATGGDTRLGGEDFDHTTVEFLLGELDRLKPPGDARKDAKVMQRLRAAAEKAKRQLSNSTSAQITVDNLFPNWHFNYKMSRSKFEALNKGHFSLCLDVVKRVLKDSKMKQPDIDEIVLVGGSTRIPKLQAALVDFFDGKHLCKSLNPDEAVAYGAAVQGAILNGKRSSKTKDMLLMDVTPLSLGIETTGRIMSVIIPRNTPIPCVKTQVYTTEANYQTKVDVSVYEGERLKSDENNLLGEFEISGIESAKRGEPQVDVSFSLDSDGILNVKAVDRKTNAEAKIEIANRSKTSDADVERMVADAEAYKMADLERIKKVEAKNELESTIYEMLEAADEISDSKLSSTLRDAAEKEQQWLDDGGDEDAKVSEIALRRRNLKLKFKRN